MAAPDAVRHEPEKSDPAKSLDAVVTTPSNVIQGSMSDEEEKVSISAVIAVFFLGMSFVAPVACGYVLVNSILNPIGQDLNDTENIVWIAGGWSVASAVSFSIAGGWSDIFGRRWVTLSGQIITLVGAIVGATAQKTTTVAAASTIIGFGAGVAFVAYPGISELLPNKYRGIGLGWTEFCINVPWAAFGVIIANKLAEEATWRWCYYIAIIYSSLCTVGIAVFYFPPSRPRRDYDKSRWDEFKELDWIGLVLFTAGLTTCLVGLTYLGKPSYSKALVASTIAVGACLTAGCFAYGFTVAGRNALFPRSLFALLRRFTVHLLIVFVSGFIWYAMAALLPQATLYAYTSDPTQIGVVAIPNGLGGVVGGWLLPSLLHRIRRVRAQIVVALVVQTAFTACYAAVIPRNRAAWMALQFFGQGCFTWLTTIAYVTAGLFVPQHELGVASGLIGTFRSAGGSIGNAVFSSILRSVTNAELAGNIARAAVRAGFDGANVGALIPAVIENAVGVPGALQAVPGGVSEAVKEATAVAFKETYAKAFRMVFYASIPFGVVATVCALWVEDPSPLLNSHIEVQMERDVVAGKKTVGVHGGGSVERVERVEEEEGRA
ncbi:major facilitator superfamily transporter protein [Diplodia corticola]|uniref:Major facilitator superfamily transporter protein n=1 Tax=Diplodia corticola TaxID=236234 RepID=A0A1J9SJR3_9PEZI|nr:major facilitator superfamily transporter protein [Diplodia corticola]OJD39996.1 major facilitator superfamily transporter protein [Diplodia corticola]